MNAPCDYDLSEDVYSLEAEEKFYVPAFVLIGSLAICALMLFGCNQAHADIAESRAVNAIIGEAEGEGYNGMKAIACALRNRGTLSGVYGEKAPRVLAHKYPEDVEAKAMVAWATSADPKECEFIHHADHWGGTKIDGHWIAKMKKAGYTQTAQINNTVFFKRGDK